jgi:hypothetical protein
MLELADKMYKKALTALEPGNKNVPPSTFKSIREAFGNLSWLNRDAIYYHIKNEITINHWIVMVKIMYLHKLIKMPTIHCNYQL